MLIFSSFLCVIIITYYHSPYHPTTTSASAIILKALAFVCAADHPLPDGPVARADRHHGVRDDAGLRAQRDAGGDHGSHLG